MEQEIWKDITGYEGHYQVSNLGRVKSLNRVIPHSKTGIRTMPERILKYGVDRYGYRIVILAKDTISKTKKIHKLVAIEFLGHKQGGYSEVVDHINSDTQDNRIENLQLITQRHNTCRNIKETRKGTSKYMGVSWEKDRNKWYSAIYINGKTRYLGRYDNEEEAGQAYQNALKELAFQK